MIRKVQGDLAGRRIPHVTGIHSIGELGNLRMCELSDDVCLPRTVHGFGTHDSTRLPHSRNDPALPLVAEPPGSRQENEGTADRRASYERHGYDCDHRESTANVIAIMEMIQTGVLRTRRDNSGDVTERQQTPDEPAYEIAVSMMTVGSLDTSRLLNVILTRLTRLRARENIGTNNTLEDTGTHDDPDAAQHDAEGTKQDGRLHQWRGNKRPRISVAPCLSTREPWK